MTAQDRPVKLAASKIRLSTGIRNNVGARKFFIAKKKAGRRLRGETSHQRPLLRPSVWRGQPYGCREEHATGERLGKQSLTLYSTDRPTNLFSARIVAPTPQPQPFGRP